MGDFLASGSSMTQFIVYPGVLFCSRAGKHGRQGAPENGDVQPQGPMVNVFQVQSHPLLEIGKVVASTDLPEAGQARLYAQPTPMGQVVEAFDLIDRKSKRLNSRHLGI